MKNVTNTGKSFENESSLLLKMLKMLCIKGRKNRLKKNQERKKDKKERKKEKKNDKKKER